MNQRAGDGQRCTHCFGQAQLYLCWKCGKAVRQLLIGMKIRDRDGRVANVEPGIIWYLDRLTESAVGQARVGSGGKVGPGSKVLLGDQRASALGRQIHNTLSMWARLVTENRGVPFMPIRSVGPSFVGPLPVGWRRLPARYEASSADMARWLAYHITAVMCEPDANEFYVEMEAAVKDIRRIIYPAPSVLIGACPTVTGEGENGPIVCSTPLYGDRDDVEVRCRHCRQTYLTADLYDYTNERIHGELLSANQMWHALHLVGADTGSRSTFFKLLATKVAPRSYEHEDGSRNQKRSQRPLYSYDDVVAALETVTKRSSRRRKRAQSSEVSAPQSF